MKEFRILALAAALGASFYTGTAQSQSNYPCHCELYCSQPLSTQYLYYKIGDTTRLDCIAQFSDYCGELGGYYSCPR